MTVKICSKCKINKDINSFYKDKSKKDGLTCACKLCCSIVVENYKKTNLEKVKATKRASTRAYYKINPIKAKAATKKWYESNRDKINIWREKTSNQRNARRRNRHKEDTKFRLNNNIRNAVYQCLKGTKKTRSWESLVGYTVDQLKIHLEKQFQPGMTWDNYGPVWHIDHIIPKSAFNFEAPEHDDFKRCWALKNLQPLFAIDNLRKNDSIKKHFQPMLAI